MKSYTKGIYLLLGSAILYSSMPVLIRTLGAGHIPPMSQVFLRYIFAFLSATIYFFWITKSKNELKKKDLFFILLLSFFGYALTNLVFTYGIILTQVGTAMFIFYCYGIITPILGFIILKEKANKFNFLALAVGVAALILLFNPTPQASWKLGAIFALLSALGQSFYLIGRKKLSGYSSKFLLLCSTFVGVVTIGVMSLIFERSFYVSQQGISSVSITTWILTVLFGIINFSAWLLMSKGFQLVKTALGSTVLLAENVFAITWAFIFFSEIPIAATFIGGLLILIASILVIFKGDNS